MMPLPTLRHQHQCRRPARTSFHPFRDHPRWRPTRRLSASSIDPTAGRSAVLVLPGFLSASAAPEYLTLCKHLRELGHPAAEILPVNLVDWLPTLQGASFTWYLTKLQAALQQLQAAQPGAPLALVGVSAGGWLARLALGSCPYDGATYGLAPSVSTLVTLGTPHGSLEAYPFGRVAEARKGEDPALPAEAAGSSLQYANYCYPDAASLAPTKVSFSGTYRCTLALGWTQLADRLTTELHAE